MRRLAALIFLVALGAAPSAAACQCGGCPPTTCAATGTELPGTSLLALRLAGQRGPLAAYDVATARLRFRLRPGIVSANGARYFTGRRSRGVTRLTAYAARTGRPLHTWPVRGVWNLGGVSASGRRVVLIRPGMPTTFAVFDATTGRETARTTLSGSWDVDAVANSGRRLFLIQYLRTGYLIRLYDFDRLQLAAQPLTEKGAPMNGTAWSAVATPSGRWLVTLYLRANGDAELHTLDLARGTAVCIDLPTAALPLAQSYSLALGRDGHTVFAANAAIGIVARVDLRTKRVVHTTHFAAMPAQIGLTPVAATSHDGRTIYFGGGSDLWAYDAAYGVVRGSYDANGIVAGLAFDRADRTLLVLHQDGTAARLSAPTGRLR